VATFKGEAGEIARDGSSIEVIGGVEGGGKKVGPELV